MWSAADLAASAVVVLRRKKNARGDRCPPLAYRTRYRGRSYDGLTWSRRTTTTIADQLAKLGITVGPNTVARLLRHMRYSLRVNRKQISTGGTPDRDRQFQYLVGCGTVSNGDCPSSASTPRDASWSATSTPASVGAPPRCVNDHDFRSAATGIGIPYGIYDTQANRGCVFLEISHETSAFAVSCLRG